MLKTSLRKLVIPATLVLASIPTLSYAAPTPGSEVIRLQSSCPTSDTECFQDTAPMLDWIWDIRVPSLQTPLRIDIGPGIFTVSDHRMFCDGAGYISVKGSGVGNTTLTGGGIPGSDGQPSVIAITNCKDIAFQDLTIKTDSRFGITGSTAGINWFGGGNSTWTNMHVLASDFAWADLNCGSGGQGTHYIFSSRLEARTAGSNAWGIYSLCGDNWAYGTEILAINDGGSGGNSPYAVIAVAANTRSGSVQLFGSTARVESTGNAKFVADLGFYGYAGLSASNGAQVHMHGGIVSVRADKGVINQDVYGARQSGSTGTVHVIDTAFNVKAGGTGVARRIANSIDQADAPPEFGPISNGVQAPFLWPRGNIPPSVISESGADLFIETDCLANGDCNSGGSDTHPHAMVYDKTCVSSGPWFDMVTGRCRGIIQ